MKKILYILFTIISVLSFVNVKAEEENVFENLTQFIPKVEDLKAQINKSLVVYENFTKEELVGKINRSLHSTVSGKGELIVDTCLEKNVDPFLATAILLHETGCEWECSYLVKACNNVGGQRGVGCNGWMAYPTLDDGIRGFINNISVNFAAKGKTKAETMTGYAANVVTWSAKVNKYISKIRAA